MNGWDDPAVGAVLASCFALSILSALAPWFNGELILLGHAVVLRSPLELAALALAAAAGQMAGKCVLYWLGAQARARAGERSPRFDRWCARLTGRHARAAVLVFVSSTVGIPPLYLTTIAAGTVGMAFPRFLGAAACGRVIRFGALVFCPQLVMRLVGSL